MPKDYGPEELKAVSQKKDALFCAKARELGVPMIPGLGEALAMAKKHPHTMYCSSERVLRYWHRLDDESLNLLLHAVVAALVAVNLVGELRRNVAGRDGPRALLLDEKRAERNAHVPHLAPVLAPAVPHVPPM